jgi:hypothetical protein
MAAPTTPPPVAAPGGVRGFVVEQRVVAHRTPV